MSKPKNPPARNQVDWDAMEPDWRAGIKTKLQLSQEFGVSRAAIDKHWAKAGVERDLTAKIQAKADALVAQAVVTGPVATATKSAETAVVEANAKLQARVRMAHRTDIQRARKLSMSLLLELESQTESNDLYRQLAELLSEPAEEDNHAAVERQRRRQELFERAIGLPGRTKTMKELADTLKTLVGLEREAFGLSVAQGDDGAIKGSVSYRANMPARA